MVAAQGAGFDKGRAPAQEKRYGSLFQKVLLTRKKVVAVACV